MVCAMASKDTHSCCDSKRVAELLRFLKEPGVPGMLFGHQDSLSYGIGWKYADDPGACDVHKVCGDYPAVFGWDIGHLETGSGTNIDGVDINVMRSQIFRAHEMGAINTISWHARNPVTNGSTWDTGNNAEFVEGSVVKHILPGGSHAKKYQQWLTLVGDFLNSLQDKDGIHIPILFRPFHEHTGSWFWWGQDHCTKEDFIELWRYTVTFLHEQMNVNNMLTIYSTDKVTSLEEYLERYPGDEWIDVLGIDVYDFPHQGVDYAKVLPECLSILKRAGELLDKPYALTETGNLCVQPEKWWTESLLRYADGYGLRWSLVWINLEEEQYYGPHPGNASAADFTAFQKSPRTIFASDLPKIFDV